ncbi:MAG: magnesium transporter CorA family protein [Finegoldia sp.]|nr:magnesium transporter CorA family protein [Finegoldia sp.]
MIYRHSIRDGDLIEAVKDEDLDWVEVINPSEEDIKFVAEKYDLPRDYLLDVNDPYEVSRVEGLEDDRPNLFALSYPVKENNYEYTTRIISIIIVDHLVITVIKGKSKVLTEFRQSRDFSKIKENGNMENFTIQLAWAITKRFIEDIKAINREISVIEEEVKKSTRTESLHKLIDIHKSLVNFKIAISENNPVIKSMFELEYLSTSEFREDLLHDLLVENKQAGTMIDKSSAMVESLSDLYTNVISNNMNNTMKILTSITIIMTIPTIIGGIWGMNVKLPFADEPHAFLIIMILNIGFSAILIYFLNKKDYL